RPRRNGLGLTHSWPPRINREGQVESCVVCIVTGLVVRNVERKVIQPHCLPAHGLERRRDSGLGIRWRLLARCDITPAVADLQIETVRVLDVKVFEPLTVVVGHRFQAALSEFPFNGPDIPRLDGKTEAFDYRSSSNASGATAVRLHRNGKRLGWS